MVRRTLKNGRSFDDLPRGSTTRMRQTPCVSLVVATGGNRCGAACQPVAGCFRLVAAVHVSAANVGCHKRRTYRLGAVSRQFRTRSRTLLTGMARDWIGRSAHTYQVRPGSRDSRKTGIHGLLPFPGIDVGSDQLLHVGGDSPQLALELLDALHVISSHSFPMGSIQLTGCR